MANLKINTKITDDKIAEIKIVCSHDVAEKIIASMRESFEIEMLRGKIVTNKKSTSIKIETEQIEKVEAIRRGMVQAWMDFSGTKPSEN